MGPEREHTNPREEATPGPRAAEEDTLSLVDALEQRPIDTLQRRLVPSQRRGPVAKGKERELRLRDHLDPRNGADRLRRLGREIELLVEGAPKGPGPVHLERQPDPQSPRLPRQLRPKLAEIDALLVRLHGRHVARRHRVRPPQRPRIPHDEAPCSIGQKEPLVRIQRDGVGLLDPAERRPPPLGEREEPPVGRVHMEPETPRSRHAGDRGEIVHSPSVGGAGVGHKEPRREPVAQVPLDGLLQSGDLESKQRVCRERADALRQDPREERRLEHGVVGLVRSVDDPPLELRREPLAPRRDERDEVGHGPAGGEDPARAGRQPHDAAQPLDHCLFELHEGGRGEPHARVPVRREGDEIRHGGLEEAAAGDVGEVARRGRIQAPWQHPAKERAEQARHRGPALRQRLAEGARDFEAPLHRVRGLVLQARHVANDELPGLREEIAHRRLVELQRRRVGVAWNLAASHRRPSPLPPSAHEGDPRAPASAPRLRARRRSPRVAPSPRALATPVGGRAARLWATRCTPLICAPCGW